MRFQQVCSLKRIFEQTWQERSLSCRITVGRLCWVIQPSLFAGHLRELSKFKGKRWERRERERKGAVRILYLSISCQSSFSKICKTRHNIFGTPGQLSKWQLSKWQLAKWQLSKWQSPEKQATNNAWFVTWTTENLTTNCPLEQLQEFGIGLPSKYIYSRSWSLVFEKLLLHGHRYLLMLPISTCQQQEYSKPYETLLPTICKILNRTWAQ